MESIYAYLDDLVTRAEQLAGEVALAYPIGQFGAVEVQRQEGFELQVVAVEPPTFSLTFVRRGNGKLEFATGTLAERTIWRSFLEEHRLRYWIDDRSKWQYIFNVDAAVPVSARFEPDPDRAAVRMSTTNLDALASRVFILPVERLTPRVLDELGKRLLGQPSKFDDIVGDRVSAEQRARMRRQIEARRREREDEVAPPGAAPTGKDGRDRRLLRRLFVREGDAEAGVQAAGEADLAPEMPLPTVPAVAEPVPEPTPPRARAPEPAEDRVPYAWIITGDVESGDTSAHVGKIGPAGAARQFKVSQIISEGAHFRLRNRAGKITYIGCIVGEYAGVEPLVDFGVDRGCLKIEYQRAPGRWELLRP
ncbi:MAG: hypothetical protein H6983_09840 [Ectothiorhodospiraceae bacterium]|nr:hypothetical protein [Chromatiales bacterium]MCP5154455.1 hypothetical protein [Ectothiorhodospiraceae bacterium]